MISLIFIPGIPFIVVIYCIVFFLYLSMVAGDVQNPDRSLFMIHFLNCKIPLLHENEIQSSVETKWFDEYIKQ